jgi:hypothetical protein
MTNRRLRPPWPPEAHCCGPTRQEIVVTQVSTEMFHVHLIDDAYIAVAVRGWAS